LVSCLNCALCRRPTLKWKILTMKATARMDPTVYSWVLEMDLNHHLKQNRCAVGEISRQYTGGSYSLVGRKIRRIWSSIRTFASNSWTYWSMTVKLLEMSSYPKQLQKKCDIETSQRGPGFELCSTRNQEGSYSFLIHAIARPILPSSLTRVRMIIMTDAFGRCAFTTTSAFANSASTLCSSQMTENAEIVQLSKESRFVARQCSFGAISRLIHA